MKITSISDGQALSVDLLDYGARIAGVHFKGKSLALTYPTTEDFAQDNFFIGATIGPITNRIANSSLKIAGETFLLPANEGPNCLHSGGNGFDQQTWCLIDSGSSYAEFKLDFDLSQVGMRGLLTTRAHFSAADGALTIRYISSCDTTTFINLTNHVYFNLSGANIGLEDHEFTLFADSFVNVDDKSIPTGKLSEVSSPLVIHLDQPASYPEFDDFVDHHFNSSADTMMRAKSLTSNISLEVSSNSPGFQFYTGKYLSRPFTESSGFCVETQLAPDAINQASFESPLLEAGQVREQKTTYKFS